MGHADMKDLTRLARVLLSESYYYMTLAKVIITVLSTVRPRLGDCRQSWAQCLSQTGRKNDSMGDLE